MEDSHATADRKAVGIRLLEAQPDLAEGLTPEDEAQARRHVVALLESLDAGPWEPADAPSGDDAYLGLLVVDGMLARASAENPEMKSHLTSRDVSTPSSSSSSSTDHMPFVLRL